MRCANCEYPLWNVSSRRCPECGRDFDLADFEFVPHSVRFCCATCNQPYFGTSEQGLPQPEAFACLKCGEPIGTHNLVVREGLGVEEQHSSLLVQPWLDRRRTGRFSGWFKTIGLALSAPAKLLKATPVDSAMAQAWWFAFITLTLYLMIGFTPWMLYYGFGGVVMGGGLSTFMMSGSSNPLLSAIFMFLAMVLWPFLFVLVWIGCAHLIVRGRARHTIRRTSQAILYTSGAFVMALVPCCGAPFGLIWWVIAATMALREAQHISTARAVVAALLPPLVLTVVGYAAWIAMIFLQITPAGGWAMGPTTPPGGMNTQQLTWMMHSLSSANGNRSPDHIIEALILTKGGGGWNWGPTLFLDPSTNTTADDVPLADRTLAEFDRASTTVRLGIAKDVLESLPIDILAYRFGDYILIDPGRAMTYDPLLWDSVMIPDPTVNGAPGPNTEFFVSSGHTITSIKSSGFAAELKKQNTYRQTIGLSPLPDLTAITHETPAIKPSSTAPDQTPPEPPDD